MAGVTCRGGDAEIRAAKAGTDDVCGGERFGRCRPASARQQGRVGLSHSVNPPRGRGQPAAPCLPEFSLTDTAPISDLLDSVRSCAICADLPLGPRPILQVDPAARLLIVGQAPGRITHGKGIPFDDPSGDRLRAWLGVGRETFYDASKVAILPMGFCFPGSGKSGDLPPRSECAAAWRQRLLDALSSVELTLIIGRYAIDWHLPAYAGRSVTEAVRSWAQVWPSHVMLPHPSPRNNRWLKSNPWFEDDVLPILRNRVRELV